jgi:hypothetical protein
MSREINTYSLIQQTPHRKTVILKESAPVHRGVACVQVPVPSIGTIIHRR